MTANLVPRHVLRSIIDNPHLLGQPEYAVWSENYDVIKAAIRIYPFAIRYAPKFQGNREMALFAVNQNGVSRIFLEKELREDEEITALAYSRIPKSFHGNPTMRREIVFLEYEDHLSQKLTELSGINEQVMGIPPLREDTSEFVRDSQVGRFSGSLLIPYQINDEHLSKIISAMVPEYISILDNEDEDVILHGAGWESQNIEQMMCLAYDLNIPFVQGESTIEGGNCILFYVGGVHGVRKVALVGEMSFYLTMRGLSEQGIYDNLKNLNRNCIGEPSSESIQISNKFMENFYSRPDFGKYYEVDKEIFEDPVMVKAQQLIAHKIMAKELEVLPENLIIIPQTAFHIDEEMLVVMPNGEVIIHDDTMVEEFLDNIPQANNIPWTEEEIGLFEEYKKTSKKKSEKFAAMREKQRSVLEKSHLVFHSMPFVFEAKSKESCLNYCNGIFTTTSNFQESEGRKRKRETGIVFITTGPSLESEKRFHEHFLSVFKMKFPDIEVKSVEGISSFLARKDGGIRCLTLETTPFNPNSL